MSQPVGAPRIYDAAKHAAIVARVRMGERVTTAAEAEGVSARTVTRWMADADGVFCRDVTQARALYLADRLAVVRTAEVSLGREADGSPVLAPDPKWAAWELERADPDNYAPSQTIVLKARDEAVTTLLAALQAGLTPAEFARVIDVLDIDDEHAAH